MLYNTKLLKRLTYSLTCIIAGLVLFNNCRPQKDVYASRENLYKKNVQDLDTRIVAYHTSDSTTQIYFALSNENLLYKRPDTSGYFYSAIKIRYVIYGFSKTKILADSGSTTFYDRQGEKIIVKDLKSSVYAKCKTGKTYVCDIFIYDLNRKTKSAIVLTIDNSRQNFLLQKPDGSIVYDYYFQPGDTVVIKSFLNNESNFVVDHFKRDFPLPPSPFTLVERTPFKYKPDSFFTVTRNLGILKITIPEKGFYHIITEKETKNGLTLFSVPSSFPGIKDETEMIRTIRYITPLQEYNKLMEADNKKLAVDEFWKEKGGSNERAKELLKKYYSRVQKANSSFTSFLPGWQSDRGMIYVVFGPPTVMYKYENSETWIYGDETIPTSIKFNFTRYINPFTDNDFVLERSEFYKLPWDQATRGWKEGHIYFDN
jgi:GWxTD domain-containing protein